MSDDVNPYRHDHNPLNADFHGGICPACEWETDEALLRGAQIGLLAERVGVPLLDWQQRLVDRIERSGL